MGGEGGYVSVLRPPFLRCRILGFEVHLSSVRWMGEIFRKCDTAGCVERLLA